MSADPIGLPSFDWSAPDYTPVFRARVGNIVSIRANLVSLPALKSYYAEHPAAFISDWGCTMDPRNVERGLPSFVPFVLFPAQVACVEWIVDRWRAGEPGLIEKSRDSGLSWLTIALACTLCLFNRGMVIGFGSRKLEYVDAIGQPKSILEKARLFMSSLPVEFTGSWNRDRHAPYCRIIFPDTGSLISGEGGDGIGRGDRASLYIVDESAFLERSELVDASLSATTNCRIDVSTPSGMGNSFAHRRHSGKVKVFTLSWQSDPRKGVDWYRKQVEELDAVTLAQEVDINYAASVEGIVIPQPWVQAAINAHVRLGITPTGMRRGALDIADQGSDKNAFAVRHGILLEDARSWSGKGSDIYRTVVRAFALCDEFDLETFDYDNDGLGAGCRGDARVINEQRSRVGKRQIRDEPFRGSASVYDPLGSMVPKRLNQDLFANLKAQSWWALRLRFQATHRAVVDRMPFAADDIISISSNIAELATLTMELSQPTYSINSVGKILIDKQPPGTRSPNLGDAVMIAFQPSSRALELWVKLGSA